MSDSSPTEPTVRRELPVPPIVRGLGGMTSPDYIDVFTMAGGVSGCTAEQWARAILADVAGRGGQIIWRVPLGLRLRAASDKVAGWRVGYRGDDWIRLEARSWFLTAHLVVVADDEWVSLGTLVHYDHRPAAAVWEVLAPIHRRLIPGLLRGARRIQLTGQLTASRQALKSR